MTRVEAGDDADAALIDRLYGGPDSDADADAELEGLRMVRGLIARVRDEAPAVEPPQAVSARLLQAAEELAPKRAAAAAVEPERPGAWARLRSWFAGIAMHPAMAAAATLVVVAGATALWMRSGGEVAEPTKQSERSQASADQGEALEQPAAPGTGAGSAAVAADPVPAPVIVAEGDKQANPSTERLGRQVPSRPQIASAGTDEKPARKSGGKPDGVRGGLAKRDQSAGDEVARGESDSDGAGAGGDDGDREAPMKVAQPTTSGGSTAQEAAPPPEPVTKTARQPPEKKKTVEPTSDAVQTEREEVSGAAMAAEYTRQAIAAAKKNNCKLVERLAVKAKDADATYYQRSFVNQADIKKCRAKKDPAKR